MSEVVPYIRALLPDGSLPAESRAHVDAQVDARVAQHVPAAVTAEAAQQIPPLVGDAIAPHIAAAKAEADRATAAADTVEEISGLTGEDEAVALLLDTPGTEVAQRVARKGDIALNAKDYGAKGDGTTDDTVALQAWLDAAPPKGAVLFLPAGRYLVPNGGLTCGTPVQIIGAGTGTYETGSGGARLVTPSLTADLLTLNTPGSVVSGVTFENTAALGTNTAGAAIRATDFDWGRIERCMFIGFWNQVQVDVGYFYSIRHSAFLRPVRYGAYMRNTAAGQHDHGDQIIDGCNFSKYGDPTNGATAIRWESGGGLRVIGSKCNAGTQPGYVNTGFWDRCIDVQMGAGSTSVFVVSGGSFEGYLADAIRIGGSAGASFGKGAITGCEFLASGSGGAVFKADGAGMTQLNSLVFSGNVAYGSGGGVSLANLSRAVVSNNELGGLALSALTLTNVDRIRFTGNQVEGQIVDNDANNASSSVGQGRDPWHYRRDFTGLVVDQQQQGRIKLGNYGNAIVTIRIRGNVQTVGGFYIEQRRHVSRTTGNHTVGATVGTDIAVGPGAAEMQLQWAATDQLRPQLSSINGKTAFGAIDVTVDGAVYAMSPAAG